MIGGVYPMLYAFFGPDGALVRDAVRAQIDAAVAAGAAGVGVLGLATEVSKLSDGERRQLVAWAAEDLAGRLPLAVTIFGPDPEAQTELARYAIGCGAAWLILQPPPAPIDQPALIRFFGATADRVDRPVAVQNAPQFLGFGLDEAGLAALNRQHPNVSIAKAEDTAIGVARLVERLEGRMAVFNGRAGLELTDNWRAGAAGMIPGLETIDVVAETWRLMAAGEEEAAERRFLDALPAINFIMQGIDQLNLYGKRIAARRLGLPMSTSRPPCAELHPQGAAWAARYADRLGPLPRG